MAWVKSSDTSGSHPIALAPLTWPPEQIDQLDPAELATLLYGLAHRCAMYSAQFTTDYVIADATVAFVIGSRWRRWADLTAKAGYWTRDDNAGGWMLVKDAEHLFHIRTRAELAWERQRKADVADPKLVVPVRLRDGDACRYCGVLVQWGARRGGRRGTYDHRQPGSPASSPDDLVVCCGSCNASRGNDPAGTWVPRAAPARPFYGPESVAMLAEHGHHVPPGDPASGRAAPPRSDPAAGRATQTRGTELERRHEHVSEPALPGMPVLQKPAETADPRPTPDRNPGRVGQGRRRRRGGQGRRRST